MTEADALTPASRPGQVGGKTSTGPPRSLTGSSLLGAKLSIPPVPPAHCPRPRLFEMLTKGTGVGLTAVTGPAGSGKTVLLSAWARSGLAPGPIAWLTLDAGDNSPATFWSYVVHAIRRQAPGLNLETHQDAGLRTVDRAVLSRLATSLASRPQPVVLVLDRAELVTNRAIATDLDLLLRYSAPGLRLVLVGRSARLVPLHRYQLTGDLAEVGADGLALTPAELNGVLRAHAINLTPEGVAGLRHSVEGWMAGVCLHALSVAPNGPGAASLPAPAGQQAVAEFLRTEVLEPQPARVRDLLMRTSVVEDIHPDLADRLTGRYDAQGTLEELVRENAFVRPLDATTFRCHGLLRQVLREELTIRHPELVRRLHGQAARWHAEQGRFPDAMGHAVKVGDWGYATTLAISRLGVAWLLTAAEAEPARAVLANLPETESGAAAHLLRAVLALAGFDAAAARTALDRADGSIRAGDDALRLEIAAARVVLGRLTGDIGVAAPAAAEVDRLLARLPLPGLAGQARTRSLVLANLGVAHFWTGNVSEARSLLVRAAEATEPGTEYSAHDALGHLALIQLCEGRLQQTERYAHESLVLAERAGLRPANRVGAASVALAATALVWNNLPAVREHMSRVLVAVGSRHDPPTAIAVALVRSSVACGRLDGRRALASIEDARGNSARWHVPRAVSDYLELAAASAHLALGDTASARRCVDAASPSPERSLALARVRVAEGDADGARQILSTFSPRGTHARATLQHAALLRARLALAGGDPGAAVQALREALEYGRPDQRRRPFVEAGAWVRQLLRQYPALAAEHTWLSSTLGPPENGGDRLIVEPLTEREVQVLQRLAQALSTKDIADSMYLSVNTVKTHLKSVYRKLGTSGRSAAARRARELNLLPGTDPDTAA
jgi:LuxR family maltose regulon positive regulatory protein